VVGVELQAAEKGQPELRMKNAELRMRVGLFSKFLILNSSFRLMAEG